MEATAAVYTGEERTIADRVNNYLAATKGSIAGIARETNYSRPTISRYLSGKYDSDTTDLERKLAEFLRDHGEELDASDSGEAPRKFLKKRTDIFESRDMKKVIGVCSAAQEDIGLGIVVAKSGFGKTYALKYYAKMPRVAYVECDDTMSSRDLVEAIERAPPMAQSGNGSTASESFATSTRAISLSSTRPISSSANTPKRRWRFFAESSIRQTSVS